ncbi:MAG: peptidyl-prolyl cis-trans isomerase [Thermoanaerobaculales bacterium]|nr:peptidyl-prolyl cis-trans isomerase [Thermoanaerobaculales bacterium]
MGNEIKVIRWFVVGLLAAGVLAAGERQTIEAILVRVNDNILTVQEFRSRIQQEIRQAPKPPNQEEFKEYSEVYLSAMVDEMILLERANQKGIVIDEEAIEEAIDGLRQENNLQDPIAFSAALRESGLTEEKLRERYSRSFMIQRAAQGEMRGAEITSAELRSVYEAEKEKYAVPAKVELEQLIFPTAEDGSDENEVLRRASAMLQRVKDGADLKAETTLAGVQVQELGAIPEQDLRDELQSLLDNLEEGEFSEPSLSPGGVQVLRLVKRIPAGYRNFEEVEEEIGRRESQRVFYEQRLNFIERLKDEYLVEVYEDRLTMALAGVVVDG